MCLRMNERSRKTRRVTANIRIDLLEEACATTGRGITETLEEGLKLIRRTISAEKARALKGRLKLKIDIEASRERSRH
jgi:hypothetical protein